MPIKPENLRRYPAGWPEIRARILERAMHRCEFCRVPNHAVGWRDETGLFHRAAGNSLLDSAGFGHLTFGEAAYIAGMTNSCDGQRDHDGRHWIVIVLTIAHLDHQPENCDPKNLRTRRHPGQMPLL